VIDQVMKNASCHDDKMEAYCNAVRALEDKFYDIELNHMPRRYNEEADELAKIASGRINVPKKNGPIFSQKTHRKCTKYASTQVLGEPTRDASG
jgi:hypothetical protein